MNEAITKKILLDISIETANAPLPEEQALHIWAEHTAQWLMLKLGHHAHTPTCSHSQPKCASQSGTPTASTITSGTLGEHISEHQVELNRYVRETVALEALRKFLCAETSQTTVSLVVVNDAQSQALNLQFRQKDKPTNVLSFPGLYDPDKHLNQLGDLVIAASTTAKEAADQGKSLQAHWAHLLIHGLLHLLGFDHIADKDANVMEQLENLLLIDLGFPAPYTDTDIQVENLAPEITGLEQNFTPKNTDARLPVQHNHLHQPQPGSHLEATP